MKEVLHSSSNFITDDIVETIIDIINETLVCGDLVPGQRSHNCKNSQQYFNR